VSEQVNRKCLQKYDFATFNPLYRPHPFKLRISWTADVGETGE